MSNLCSRLCIALTWGFSKLNIDEYCVLATFGVFRTNLADGSHVPEYTNLLLIIPLALLSYDYLITLDKEVTLFWVPHRINGAFFLFLLNRYLFLAAQILAVAPEPSSFEVSGILFYPST